MTSARRRSLWDRVGAVLSGVCLVHCLAVPVVFALLPLWPVADALHAWMHPAMAAVLLPVTALAAVAGYRAHHRREVPAVLALGLALVFAGAIFGHEASHLFAWSAATSEAVFTVGGSLVLVAGHTANALAGRRMGAAACSCPNHAHAHDKTA